MRILIADDSPISRFVLKKNLAEWGFDVVEAANGDQAWEILQEKDPPRIAVLDWIMPGLDGVELCRLLGTRIGGPFIYTILLTSKKEKADLVYALESGAHNFQSKPITAEELRSHVNVGRRLVEADDKIKERTAELLHANQALQREIVERKRMEAALWEARDYLQNVIDSMPSVLIGVDTNRRVTQWNAEAQRLTGLGSDRARGKFLPEVFPLLTSQLTRILECLERREPLRVEKYQVQTNGLARYYDLVFYPLEAVEAPGVVIRMDDITARTRMEEMMIQAEKMASIGGLAAGMAHEINNPLTAILQGAQMIQRRFELDHPRNRAVLEESGLPSGLNEAWRRYMDTAKITRFLDGIIESGQRAARIVADMLEFSSKKGSSIEPRPLPGIIDRAFGWAASDLEIKSGIQAYHVEMTREYDPDLGLVLCDPQQVQQVIINLVKNAVQALARRLVGAGPESPPLVLIRTRRDNNQAVVEVIDTGPGVPPELEDRIFEPFVTAQPIGQGTGLGLYVSFQIVRNHGGIMRYGRDEQGRTCFAFTLPLA